MRKKSGFTIVEQAITLVPEFEKVVRKLEQQVTLRGQSKSTLQNYIRRIALFVVHFEKLPEQIDPEEINEYLVALARDPKSPSRSSFKHMVYGLRYYYRLLGMNKNAIALPSLKKDTKLPVILNQQELKELFAAVWNTLRSFGYTHYGVESGAVAVLHTWGQNLSLHPYIHCIVPAAGYTLDRQWKNIGHSGKFLYPVYQLSDAFKGRFLDSLKRALRKQNELQLFDDVVQQAYYAKWVVHCEPSLAGVEHVVKYLGQYTHRVAITNQRILNIAEGKVTFIAKDYRDGAIKKPITLDGVEFLHRFTMHVLPGRFVKIRRYGIYNHTVKRNLKLQFIPEQSPDIDTLIKRKEPPETNLQRFQRLTGIDPCRCPVCKKGRMVRIRELPRIRSPAWRQAFQRSAI